MKRKPKQPQDKAANREFIFHRKNYIFMFIGIACMALGFILMSGGGTDDPNVFSPDIFSFRRIRLAPTLVLLGLGIEVYAIMLNPHKKKDN
jgi:NADH:ubiquinone oxidoreductase subunit K